MIKIAISMRVDVSAYGERRDALAQDWYPLLASIGAQPHLIPNTLPDPTALLKGLAPDMLILSGGNDLVGPTAAPERDATEVALIDYFVTSKRPVLGVCRGLHILNAHFGGRIAGSIGHKGHVAHDHTVSLSGRLADAAGRTQSIVNSYHDYGLHHGDEAPGFEVAGLSDDGMIEALLHSALPIAAVQWHPERTAAQDDPGRQLMRWLAEGRRF
jgi:gamma-glutamyl-gamma-aminobutyrate hydrolase PuuD